MMHIDRRKAPRLTMFEEHAVHAMNVRLALKDCPESETTKLEAALKYHELRCAMEKDAKP